jgi:hypothetical protein
MAWFDIRPKEKEMVRYSPIDGASAGGQQNGQPQRMLQIKIALRQALEQRRLSQAVKQMEILEKWPLYAKEQLLDDYLRVAELAGASGKNAVAADFYMRAIEVDVAGDHFYFAAGKLQGLGKDKEAAAVVKPRLSAYIARLRFRPEVRGELNACSVVHILAVEFLPLSRWMLDFAYRIYSVSSDPAMKTSLAQEGLFRLRHFENITGNSADRGQAREYAEWVAGGEDFFRKHSQGVYYTTVVDLAHFGFWDLLERVANWPQRDAEVDLYFSVRDKYYRYQTLMQEGKTEEAQMALMEAVCKLGNRGSEERQPELDSDEHVIALAFRRLSCALRIETMVQLGSGWESVIYSPAGDFEVVLAQTSENDLELSRLIERKIRAILDLFSDYLTHETGAPVDYICYHIDYDSILSAEKGSCRFGLAPFADKGVLNIDTSGGEGKAPFVVLTLPARSGKIFPPHFEAVAPLYQKYMVLRALGGILRCLGELKEKEILLKSRSMLDEVDNEVRKRAGEIAQKREEENRLARLRCFTDAARAAEPELLAREDEMLQRYFAARDIVDRLAHSFSIPQITYSLTVNDFLRGWVRAVSITVRERMNYDILIFLARLPEGIEDKPVALSLDGAAEKITSEGFSLGIFETYLFELVFEVLARYLSIRVLPDQYSGYVVQMEPGGAQTLVEASPGAALPSLQRIFDSGFDCLLRAQGILAFDLFTESKGIYAPLGVADEKAKEHQVRIQGAENIFVSRQKRGRICRLPVGKIRGAEGKPALGAYHASDKAQEQKGKMGDPRPLPRKTGVYIVTSLPDGEEHLYPLLFKENEEELLTADSDGKDLLDRIGEEVRGGKYRDPKILLKTTDAKDRKRLEPLIRSGNFSQRVETFDVEYTFRKPDFVPVADLLAQGYSLRP